MNDTDIDNTDKRITEEITKVSLKQRFFAVCMGELRHVVSTAVPTAATDGDVVLYNPHFIGGLKDDEVRGLILHETGHAFRGHHVRRKDRDPVLWNIATDHRINLDLLELADEVPGLLRLPQGALCDPRFKDMAEEEIYAVLEEESPPSCSGKQGGDDGGGGSGEEGDFDDPSAPGNAVNGNPQKWGEVLDGKAAGEGESAEREEADRWGRIASRAATVAEMYGSASASVRKLVNRMGKPEVDWRTILRQFLTPGAPSDWSFCRPDRRFDPRTAYLPSVDGEDMGRIGIAIDCSGSIYGVAEILSAFAAEVNRIVEDTAPASVVVRYFDVPVTGQAEFGRGEPVQLDPVGGGGTSFVNVLDAFDCDDDPVVALVVFTDTYGDFPSRPPRMPVMWVSYGGDNVPFGRLIKARNN